jgi:hypothetical protein
LKFQREVIVIIKAVEYGNIMGGACSAYGGGEMRVQGFGGEAWGKETIGETQA